MKNKIYFLLTLLMLTTTLTNAQTWQWANQAGGQYEDVGFGVCYDQNGFIYSTGCFIGTASFGNNIIISTQNTDDIYIAKYDTLGNNIWVKKAGGTAYRFEYGTAIVSDNLGNIYLTGYFEDFATFDTTTFHAYSVAADIFLAKYNSNGNLIWLKHMDTGNHLFSSSFHPSLSIDNMNNVYLYGHYQGVFPTNSVVFDGVTLVDEKSESMFIAKYNSNGQKQWVKTINGISYFPYEFDISTDYFGNSFVTGNFKDTAYFGTNTLVSTGYSDIFIVKYDNAGNLVWVKKGGGIQTEKACGIAIDYHNNVYVSGLFSGTAIFDMDSIMETTTEKVFLAKYDYNGNIVWLKRFAGDYNNEISCDTSGNCYLASQYFGLDGQIIVGIDTLIGVGTPEFYIAKINSNGIVSEVVQAKAQDYIILEDLDVDYNGNCYTIGCFEGSTIFGQTSLVCNDIGLCNIIITKSSFDSLSSSIASCNVLNKFINVYPNPSNGRFIIEFDNKNNEVYHLKIISRTGQLIETIDNFNSGQIDLSKGVLKSGLYFLQLYSDRGEYYIGRIIIN